MCQKGFVCRTNVYEKTRQEDDDNQNNHNNNNNKKVSK